MTLLRPCLLAVASAAIASCGGGGGGGSTTSPPQAVLQKATTASGDAQTGPVAAALPSPLRVLVTLSGSPLAGVTVVWSTSGTGASVSPPQSVTDGSGIAATSWTLSQAAGPQNATASSNGVTGSPIGFTASARAAGAVALVKASGDSQVGALSTNLANPAVVRVTDAFGNPVTGITVAWAVTSGPATVNPLSDTTGAGGAQTTVQLGATTGGVVFTATSTGLTGSPVTFHATSVALSSTAAVQVGDFFFQSGKNGTQNPAVDTIAAGGTVTWTWVGAASHGVQSTGSPSFTNSVTQTSGTYSFTFNSVGTYTYDCAVHGVAMTGRVVVK